MKLPLLGAIAAVIFAACAALLYFQYRDATALAEASALRAFAEGASRAEDQVDGLLDRAIALAQVGPAVTGVGDPVRSDGRDHPALAFLKAAVTSAPSIYAAYYGAADGSFLEAIATHGDAAVSNALGAPAGTAIVVRTVVPENDREASQNWTFLDVSGVVLGQKSEANPAYDPRHTDWYRRAKGEDGPVLSEPYRFSSIPVLGVTVVQNLPQGRGVFGVDFTLGELGRFIVEHPVSPNGALYIFDNSLDLIAAPPFGPNGVPPVKLMSDMRSLGLPLLQMLADVSRSPSANETTLARVQSVDYIALVTRWRGKAAPSISIGIVAPLSDFASAMETAFRRTVFVTAAILIAAIVLVAWFARQSIRLSRSEQQLAARRDA